MIIQRKACWFKCFVLLLCLLSGVVQEAWAQQRGKIVDAANGSVVPWATVKYRTGKEATMADSLGVFSIARKVNGILIFNAFGYEQQQYIIRADSPKEVEIVMTPISKTMEEVIVSGKKKKYSKKENPSVELMRKVIAMKRNYDVHRHPHVRYKSYQKIMAGLNDLKPHDLNKGIFGKRPWLRNNLEVCQYNGKVIMPFTVEEQVNERFFRQDPKLKTDVMLGQNIAGINTMFQTGDIVNQVLKEYFTDIDIYQDKIKLLQSSFCSPIGKDAIQFYHYFITDTLQLDDEKCYQVDFTPANKQDFGFCGQLFILADSSYQVKRCEMSIPVSSDVNWVYAMKAIQEYTKLENGWRVKTTDDLIAELMVTDFLAKLIITRNTRNTDYNFEEFSDSVVNNEEKLAQTMQAKDNKQIFWETNRPMPLTGAEIALDSLVTNIKKQRGTKFIMFLLKAHLERYIETGTKNRPSKFDIGPFFSILTKNSYDGWRLRAGGQTTANLHPHIFLNGYYAYATRSNQHYFDAQVTYRFNKAKYAVHEFPRKSVSFEILRDVVLENDKEDVFSAVKMNNKDKLFLHNRKVLSGQYEVKWGMRYFGEVKVERITPVENQFFRTLSPTNERIYNMDLTEVTAGLRYEPGVTYLNTKQKRKTLNYNAPVIQVQHSVGISGFLGGNYTYNLTDIELIKKFWLPKSWGNINTSFRFVSQWSQVPYPLLKMPPTNSSFIIKPYAFDLMNNMELLNDKYASAIIKWDLNGKIFNKIPLIKKLKCREIVGFKCMWGTLSDKNNPYLPSNQGSQILMQFPEGCYVMDINRPYMEVSVGIHNILNLLHVEYCRRLSYLDLPNIKRGVVKIAIELKF